MRSNYRSSAIFCCGRCKAKAKVTSTAEFVPPYAKDECSQCGRFSFEKYQVTVVQRTDCDKAEPEIDWGCLQHEHSGCRYCAPVTPVSWTAITLNCKKCHTGVMRFHQFAGGAIPQSLVHLHPGPVNNLIKLHHFLNKDAAVKFMVRR